MEYFVTDLIRKSDLSILTTKAVRKAYETHIQKSLSSDEKKKLKALVNDTLEQLALEMKDPIPRKSPRKTPTEIVPPESIPPTPLSPEKLSGSEETRLPESGQTRSSPRKSARSPSPSKSETSKHLPRKATRKIESDTEVKEIGDVIEQSQTKAFNESEERTLLPRKTSRSPSPLKIDSSTGLLSPKKQVRKVECKPQQIEETITNEESQEKKSTENGQIRSSPKKKYRSLSQPKSGVSKRSGRRSSKKVESYAEVDEESESLEETGEVNENIQKNVECDFKKENVDDRLSDNNDTDFNEKIVDLPKTKSKTKHKSPKKKAKVKKSCDNGQVKESSDISDSVSPSRPKLKLSISLTKLKSYFPESSDIKPSDSNSDVDSDLPSGLGKEDSVNSVSSSLSNQQAISLSKGDNSVTEAPSSSKKLKRSNKNKKNLSVNDALQAVMDSDKDAALSEDPSVTIDSESQSDTEMTITLDTDSEEEVVVKKRKGQKRKVISSLDDSEVKMSDTEQTSITKKKSSSKKPGKKKKAPSKKPLPKKRRVISDEESLGDEKDAEVEETSVTENQTTHENPVSEMMTSPKKKLPKKQKVMSDVDSDDSGDDRLHIDVRVSTKTQNQNLTSRKRPGRGIAMVTRYAESDSEMESVSSKAESLSDKIESDAASVDSGVNVHLKTYTGKQKKKKEKLKRSFIRNEIYDDQEKLNGVQKNTTIFGEDTVLRDVDKDLTDGGKRSQKSEKRSQINRRTVKQNSHTGAFHDDGSEKKRSVFSLSETESDQNVYNQKKELAKEFHQRHIAKLLRGESFDVKQCSILLERIDDQIESVKKTGRCKISSGISSWWSSSPVNIDESDDSSFDITELRRKKKKKSPFPESSTPLTSKGLKIKLKKNVLLLSDNSDCDDLPLKSFRQRDALNSEFALNLENLDDTALTFGKKGKHKVGTPNLTFDSDDLPLKSVKRKKKVKNRAFDSTFDSDDLPLSSSKVAIGEGKELDLTLGSDDLPLKSSKKKHRVRSKILDSTFSSDDLPLKPPGKKKGKSKALNVTVGSDNELDLSLKKGKGKSKKLDSSFGSDDLPLKLVVKRDKDSYQMLDLTFECDDALKSVRKNGKSKGKTLDITLDSDDSPLKTFRKKTKSQSKAFDSSFGSDDLPLQTFKKAGKRSSRKRCLTSDSDNLPLKLLSKRDSDKIRVLDSTFDSDELPENSSGIKGRGRGKISDSEEEDNKPISSLVGNGRSTNTSVSDLQSENNNNVSTVRHSAKSKSKKIKQARRPSQLESSDDDSDDETLHKVNSSADADAHYKMDASGSGSNSNSSFNETTRTSPHKLENSVSVSPSKLTRSHTQSPDKLKPSDIVSESEEGSDVGSLDDSIRSLEMLKRETENSTKSNKSPKSVNKSKGDNLSPDKGTARKRHVCDSDSDLSSVIEPQDCEEISAVNGTDCPSETSSVEGTDQNGSILDQRTLQKEHGLESSDSDDSDNEPSLADLKKSAAAVSVDSDDSGTSVDLEKSEQMKSKSKGDRTTTDKENHGSGYKVSLAELRKICRCVGILLRNTIELFGCETDDQKRVRIMEILRKRGMQGKPSMSKAKALKLKKEASELNTDNIISSSGRSQRRKVESRYKRRGSTPSPSPKKTVTPLKLKLSGLRGIIDSEGSESD